jgi:hypothetical protein
MLGCRYVNGFQFPRNSQEKEWSWSMNALKGIDSRVRERESLIRIGPKAEFPTEIRNRGCGWMSLARKSAWIKEPSRVSLKLEKGGV